MEDEALAVALGESAPGEEVVLHAADCQLGQLGRPPTAEELASCGCRQLVLVVGASS